MKNRLFIICILCILCLAASHAQNFQGVATYKTSTSLDIKLDSNAISGDQQKMLMNMLNQYLKKEYELAFTKSTSLYKEVEQLQQGGFPGMDILGTFSGGGGIFFKNIPESRSIRQLEFFGKQFLIKDTLNHLDWKLGKETKMIGSYTCYKATATKEVVLKTISTGDSTGNLDEENQNKMITITAWYTPQIPVSQGPDEYWGLPGLIMEVNNGSTIFLCSKVVLNPSDKVNIEEPDKGQEVTQEEFKEIVTKKMEEMKEIYGGDNRNAGKSGMTIQIPN